MPETTERWEALALVPFVAVLLIGGLYVLLRHAQRRAERARRDADEAARLRDAFLAAAAHGLHGPLTTILGACARSRQRLRYEQPHEVERYTATLAAIESNARDVARQIEQLLDVACAEGGRPLGLRRTPTDLVELVERVVAARSSTSLRHDLQLQTEFDQLIGSVDAARVERVVDKLLANAVKYSPLGGKVVVRLSREKDAMGPCAVLAVLDEGLGIPATDIGRIFELFHRASNVGPIDGTGIGLASTRQIVEEHGGRISVTSREGAGSTFKVYLPVQLQPGAENGASARGV
jgi:signal transduction histidine kinase